MSNSNHKPVNFASIKNTSFNLLSVTFITVMILSNIVASKPVTLLPNLTINWGLLHTSGILTDAAFFLFPVSYAIGDVISEVFGYTAMRKTVFYGFIMIILAALTFQIAIHLPKANYYENQAGFSNTLGITWVFLGGALAGYLCGELLNSYTLVQIKKYTGEPKLWLRLVTSTIVGELIDTLVFCSIVAKPGLGIDNLADFVNYTFFGFIWKSVAEILLLPITYILVNFIKRNEPDYGITTKNQQNVPQR